MEKVLKNGDYKKEDIEQAIAVTRRAKYRQEITKNPAGYFLKALKEKYTDEKEEAKKTKKERGAKVKKLKAHLEQLKEELAQTINTIIREITADDESITLQAIEAIKANNLTMALVKLKEKNLGRTLTVQDYREDKHLRAMVINSIVQTQPQYFEAAHTKYNTQIKEIEKQLSKS